MCPQNKEDARYCYLAVRGVGYEKTTHKNYIYKRLNWPSIIEVKLTTPPYLSLLTPFLFICDTCSIPHELIACLISDHGRHFLSYK